MLFRSERDGRPIALIGIHAHDGRVLGPMELEWRDVADVGEAVVTDRAEGDRPQLSALQ